MLKIGSAVHTAHGPGTVTETETTRGRTQYKVAGSGFQVWIDETKIAAAEDNLERGERSWDESQAEHGDMFYGPGKSGPKFSEEYLRSHPERFPHGHGLEARRASLGDVDESNSIALPYDYTPQHPTELYSQESTMSPDHDVDLDDRLRPTDSISGDSASLPYDYPGPNPDLFAKSSRRLAYYDDGADGGTYDDFNDPAPGSPQADYVNPVTARGWNDLSGDDAEIYDRDGATVSGVGDGVAEERAYLLRLPGEKDYMPIRFSDPHEAMDFAEKRLSDESEISGGQGELNYTASLRHAEVSEQDEPPLCPCGKHYVTQGYGHKEWQKQMDEANESWFVDDPEEHFNKLVEGSRPAGLSDKYIDLPPERIAAHDIVAQFREDPVGTIERTAYLVESSTGLDPSMGQYMDLVDADPIIREAAWRDVAAKANRLRHEGAVHVKDIASDQIYASVDGDHGTYEVMVKKAGAYGGIGGGNTISHWRCSCDWGKWAFKRQMTFVGRLCSHGYATYMTMQGEHFKGQPRQQKLPKARRRVAAEGVGPFKQRPERDYEVKGYSEGDGELRSQGKPERLSPDFYKVPEPEKQHFVDVEKDDRKTTGPDQITAGTSKYAPGGKLDRERKAQEQAASNQKIDNAFSGWQGRVHPSYHDTFDNAFDFFHDDMVGTDQYEDLFGDDDKRNAVYDRLQSKFPLTSRNAKVDKKWADDHAGLDDGEEHQPIVHFSALTYTADENLLKKLRDLSAESNAENFGNMAQHNHEISEVIGELHERGYDANRLVASIRTATDDDPLKPKVPGTVNLPAFLPGSEMALSSSETNAVPTAITGLMPGSEMGIKRDESPGASLFGKGGEGINATPAGNGTGKAPTGLPPAPATPGGGGGAGGAGSPGGGGGGSDWKPNGITDSIGAGDYKIQSGDTLTSIMDRAKGADGGLGVSDLAKANNIDNPDKIFAGDTLHIPGTDNNKPAGEAPAPAPGAPLPAEAGAAAPMSGTPGVPPAPGPAPADGTSGQPMPDPGVGGGVGFPANTSGSITDPGLSAPGQHLSVRRYADDSNDPTKKLNTGDGSLFGNSANGVSTTTPVAAPAAAPAAAPLSPRGVPDPGPTPAQMTDNSFSSPQQKAPAQTSQPSDGSKKLEDDKPPNGSSTSGYNGFGSDLGSSMSTILPIAEGIGSAVMPAVTQGLSGLASGAGGGLASGIGSALSGLLSFASLDDAGFGPDTYGTSEDYVDEHERPNFIDLTDEPEDDMISYKTQPRQAAHGSGSREYEDALARDVYENPNRYSDDGPQSGSLEYEDALARDVYEHPERYDSDSGIPDDGSDIVAAFQRNAANSALGSGAGGGGAYSDDAISQAAQGFLRTAGRIYSLAEQQELMDEAHPQGARNLPGLDLRGTHYLEG